MFPPPIERGRSVSILVSDRDGRPLRAFPLENGTWRFATKLDDLDPVFLQALLEVEDKRYWSHAGVDWTGMSRAVLTSLLAGEIVSGGSTISMQTARLLEPRPHRTISAKLIEMFRAYQLEARLSKVEILELYLTLTPYGGNIEGVRAASWRYFGRSPDRLTDDQIALLIALPQSPEVRRPDLNPKGAQAGRAIISRKLHRLGFFSKKRAEEAIHDPFPTGRYAFPARAWQATARAARGAQQDVISTLDMQLQSELEAILIRRAKVLDLDVQMAGLVVHIPTRAVRASIGSAGRDRPGGWMDLTAQIRSPGSTLKPFIYAMAFDDGSAAPNTKIADIPHNFSAYQPENFDRSFRGSVRVSEALQHSLNIPAVLALERIGPQRFAAALDLAGASPRLGRTPEHRAGLALALGGAGMTARDLAVLYAALGGDGIARPLIWQEDNVESGASDPGYRLMSRDSAQKILNILQDTPSPSGRMPGRLTASAPQVAFKTGTSYGFRDAWAAGVAGDYAFVVWVGRADGAPRPGQTGRKAALPILFEMADRVNERFGGANSAQVRLTSRTSRKASGSQSQFAEEDTPPQILFPPKNAELWAGQINSGEARPFVLAGQGNGALAWYVNGLPVKIDGAGLPVWRPSAAGFYDVVVVDPTGRSNSVSVRVLMADSS